MNPAPELSCYAILCLARPTGALARLPADWSPEVASAANDAAAAVISVADAFSALDEAIASGLITTEDAAAWKEHVTRELHSFIALSSEIAGGSYVQLMDALKRYAARALAGDVVGPPVATTP